MGAYSRGAYSSVGIYFRINGIVFVFLITFGPLEEEV